LILNEIILWFLVIQRIAVFINQSLSNLQQTAKYLWEMSKIFPDGIFDGTKIKMLFALPRYHELEKSSMMVSRLHKA